MNKSSIDLNPVTNIYDSKSIQDAGQGLAFPGAVGLVSG